MNPPQCTLKTTGLFHLHLGYPTFKVIRILKKEPERCHAPSRCQEHLNFCAFLELLRKSKQSLRAAEKSQEKLKLTLHWLLSRVLWFSVSRNVLFCQENKKFKCWQLLAGAWYLSGSPFLNNYNFTWNTWFKQDFWRPFFLSKSEKS